MIAAIVFFAVAAAHAYRAYTGAVIFVALGHIIPLWVSWPAAAISLLLGVMLIAEARR